MKVTGVPLLLRELGLELCVARAATLPLSSSLLLVLCPEQPPTPHGVPHPGRLAAG